MLLYKQLLHAGSKTGLVYVLTEKRRSNQRELAAKSCRFTVGQSQKNARIDIPYALKYKLSVKRQFAIGVGFHCLFICWFVLVTCFIFCFLFCLGEYGRK